MLSEQSGTPDDEVHRECRQEVLLVAAHWYNALPKLVATCRMHWDVRVVNIHDMTVTIGVAGVEDRQLLHCHGRLPLL